MAALVTAGRAGQATAVRDSAPGQNYLTGEQRRRRSTSCPSVPSSGDRFSVSLLSHAPDGSRPYARTAGPRDSVDGWGGVTLTQRMRKGAGARTLIWRPLPFLQTRSCSLTSKDVNGPRANPSACAAGFGELLHTLGGRSAPARVGLLLHARRCDVCNRRTAT